jgi:hypothetical protein
MHRQPEPHTASERQPRLSLSLCLSLLWILLALAGSGCTRRSAATDQAPDLRVELVDLQPDPPVVGQAILVLRLTDGSGNPMSGASVDFKADMTHAGMTPVFGDVTEQGGGLYRTMFEWTMAGDWILSVSGTLQDGRTFRRELQVSVSPDGG